MTGCYSGFTLTVLCHVIITLFTRRVTGCYSGFLLSHFCDTSASLYKKNVTGCYSGFTLSDSHFSVTISASLLQEVSQGAVLVSLSHFCVTCQPLLHELDEEWQCYSGFTLSLLDHMLASLYKKSGTGCYSGFNLTLLCHISASFYKKSGTEQVTVSLVQSDRLPGWVIMFLLSQFCVFSIFRLSLPEEWQGVRDEELSTKSGIPGCIFVHASGFIGGNKTYEGALTMAQTALKQSGKSEV